MGRGTVYLSIRVLWGNFLYTLSGNWNVLIKMTIIINNRRNLHYASIIVFINTLHVHSKFFSFVIFSFVFRRYRQNITKTPKRERKNTQKEMKKSIRISRRIVLCEGLEYKWSIIKAIYYDRVGPIRKSITDWTTTLANLFLLQQKYKNWQVVVVRIQLA